MKRHDAAKKFESNYNMAHRINGLKAFFVFLPTICPRLRAKIKQLQAAQLPIVAYWEVHENMCPSSF